MTAKDTISTLKYIAGTRPAFFLSEILCCLDEPLSVDEVFALIRPRLQELNLAAEKTGDDYRITRCVPARPYCLNDGERRRLFLFFSGHALPSPIERSIEQYITKKVGKDWDDPVILGRLRRAITAQKDGYWRPERKQPVKYTKGYSVLGYLAYHFPVYFMQTEHLLAMLARDGLLKQSMTVLDAGTGPGVVPLAIADFYSRLDGARATVYSVERSEEHIEAFVFLRDACVPKGGRVGIKRPVNADVRDLPDAALKEKIDLVVFSNVLNELSGTSADERADIVMRTAENLAQDGSILIVEPAEESASTRLRQLSLALKKRGLAIHSPCSFVWGTNCTPDRCWSFVTAPEIRPTALMKALADCDEPYRYVNTDIKYSYVVLQKDGRRKETCRVPPKSKVLRLSSIHRHTGRRVNVIASKMSEDLGDARTHVFLLCDGSAQGPVYGVLPSFHITPANDLLMQAPYGTILELQNVLVRYNKAHDAYNLLVNRNTKIYPAVHGREKTRDFSRKQ
jgi:hypothetical protein